MIKSVRNFAIVAVLSLVTAPSLMANRMGCNPHPQAVQPSAVVQVIQYGVLAYFGL